MKKIYALAAMLGMAAIAHAQNPEIKSELPTILPPSPTVAALMKFEEVPVSNYTGVPDISIPVFSTPTRSKDINLDISLKYHPASAAASETASDAGLGWSLFVGGTVSRSVRGIPDEHLTIGKKSGIYRTESSGNPFPNPYYELIGRTGQPSSNPAKWNEFLWNAQEKGIYDTEHDLWQFNFMGYSGRFIMKKNAAGQLEVVVQDLSNNLKIVNTYNTSTFAPTGFTIYDDKGYKYVFDVAETTASTASLISTSFAERGSSSISPTVTYISSFHLSGVYDNNQQRLLGYTYNKPTEIMNEVSVTKSLTTAVSLDTSISDLLIYMKQYGDDLQSQDLKLDPRETISSNKLEVSSKKIKRIDVDGIARIYMDYQSGRQDQSLSASAYRIRSITAKTWADSIGIKKTELFHSYRETENDNKRMFLDRVEESNFADTKKNIYKLYYEAHFPDTGTFIKDLWGYFTLRPNSIAGVNFKETSPKYCSTDILQKMELPTGGSILFDFESNEYSYIGDTPVTDFSGNPLNWTAQSASKSITIRNVPSAFFTIAEAQQVVFNTEITPAISGWSFILTNASAGADILLTYAPTENEPPPTEFSVFLPAGSYSVKFNHTIIGLPPFTANITAHYKVSSGANKQYLFGGGVRIGRIGFFDAGNVPQNYYDNPTGFTPAKEKKYSYRSFAQPAKSSGSLVFGLPVFQYQQTKQHHFEFTCGTNEVCESFVTPINYRFTTDFNNLQAQRTKGSDVGYQNASVSETANGRTEHTYSSPIDVPENEDAYSISYPFFPSENFDHRRGYLKKEEVFDNSSKILSRTEYTYVPINEVQDMTLIGVRPYYAPINCPTSYKFANYDLYFQKTQDCPGNPTAFLCEYLCGDAMNYISYKKIYEAYGWARLEGKTTKSFFYSGSVQTEVGTSESYAYNALNKKIASQTTTLGTGEVLKTDFYYHAGNSPYSQNRISEIERVDSYRNSELLSTSRIVYSNAFAGNAAWLPQAVQASKGANALEAKVRYNSYDQYGHPLEVQQENGMKVSYVWGYSRTQPVAKIDNMAYASLPAGLVTAVQNASDAAPFNNTAEASLLSALEDLRIAATASGGQMTGYAYRPLVGVSAVIDPKGDRTYYEYDGFGRLKAAYDRNGKLLSENEYHYRTQN
ncbi:hypothetical protein MH928_03025 [Flavobacterium sp. WW92]|uniref:hypothetical protein n=1 Tax=unclassified Flavobacterium TaxID=196869 RepID=UPI0022258CEB|nr:MULTISPECIES: hypothetical protein [unclassified Flavobacterium]WDO13683.1 hypothetical protein MH928_03025 [Flavobacterium sp. WW92]